MERCVFYSPGKWDRTGTHGSNACACRDKQMKCQNKWQRGAFTAYETHGRLQSRRGIVLQDNNAVCVASEGWNPFTESPSSPQLRGGWSGSQQETLITDAIAQAESFFFFFFHNNAFDVEKHRNNLNAEGRDYYEIKTPAHICIHRAILFTRTLQTMHYHFKAGQVWFLVHTWKTGWKLCLSGYIPLYFCSLGCKLRARGPP